MRDPNFPHTEPIDLKSPHYDAGGISVMDVIKAKMTAEQFEGFLLGNIIKYSTRCNFKGSKTRDVEKIGVYADLLKKHLVDSLNLRLNSEL